jgi:UDP-N-acetylglucosamine 2-epimerase (non-hydrolysing)
MKVLTVFGTRPEAIKMYPVIKELLKYKKRIKSCVCVTAQHRQMLDPFLNNFNIKPDYDLNIMRSKQTLEYVTNTVLSKVSQIIKKEKPDYILVQGDTTTSMAASLAAFYSNVKIGHIEAGLRTYDKNKPFPEEANRCFIDAMSDLFFVHTKQAKENLLKEGKSANQIYVTGNTVIDAVLDVSKGKTKIDDPVLSRMISLRKKIILVTAHRRENLGEPLERICQALKRIALKYGQEVVIVYPVHLNPAVGQIARRVLKDIPNVYLAGPLDYFSFVHLMKVSYLILSDSGGIQEEAPSLHKPVLVLREVTERPEALKAGATKLVGTNIKRIVDQVSLLIENRKAYQKMAQVRNPYGDGQASKRIVARLLKG